MTSIVVAPSVILLGDEAGFTLDNPVIGWRTSTIVSATSEEADHPATNLLNPATHVFWRAAHTGQQFLTFSGYDDSFDYAAIARHNLGSFQVPISIGYLNNNSPGSYVPLINDVLLPDDGPVMFRFTATALSNLTIRIGSHGDPGNVQIAVAYCGKLL
ncbi:MAG TPA: hypothetical protein VJW55_04805, partial [Candidatus Angelobacter sp.]|nr:hypothetical protein [Candidatus Angelobacter sp.]